MLLKIKSYEIEPGIFSDSIKEYDERWITDNFTSLYFYTEVDGKKYYAIFSAPTHKTIINEDDFNKICAVMNK